MKKENLCGRKWKGNGRFISLELLDKDLLEKKMECFFASSSDNLSKYFAIPDLGYLEYGPSKRILICRADTLYFYLRKNPLCFARR